MSAKNITGGNSSSYLYAIGILVINLFLISCGGGGGGGSSSSGTSGHNSATGTVGTTECFTCHADGAMVVSSSGVSVQGGSSSDNTIFSSWLNGPHGNYEGDLHADHGIYNEGYPYYGYNGLGSSSGCAVTCHDQLSDGQRFADFYLSTGISSLGVENRPVIGCESCHGSGANHFGVGSITAAPGSATCGDCHNADFSCVANQNEADNIYEDYLTSPHASSIGSAHYVSGSATDVKGSCSRCHTDEGGREYRDIQGGHDDLAAALASQAAIAGANNMQCHTCHDAHDPDQLLQPAGGGASSEYMTCTNCHQSSDGYHGENNADQWSGMELGVGTLDTSRIIYDSHSDDETTDNIEGYNIRSSNDRSCRDCHNPHNADTTINVDWANSAHGGHILETTQDPTTHKYNVTETEGPAFVHYDMKASNRQACQRCHTSTGFMNFADNPAAYDPADNDFSYLDVTTKRKEMLYCWACHTSSVGDLRDPGAFENTAQYASPASRISAVPDLSGSNLCLSCHAGRESGTEDINDSTADFSNKSFVNSHYLAAGGVLFRTALYEFSGQDYSNDVAFAHDKIGTTGASGMGSNGPCVGCHMKTANGHTLVNVTKSGGVITDITAFTLTCSNCHADKAALITTLNELEEGFSAALDALATELSNNGFPYTSGYPYFAAKNWITANDATGKKNMGAAFNYNLLLHEPGAYVHNPQYTKKIIYDSIDFLDDGAMNASVEATVGAGLAADYLGGTR